MLVLLLLATLWPPIQMEIRLTPSAQLEAPTKTKNLAGDVAARCEDRSRERDGLLQICHHVLDHGVVLQRVNAQILAVAGLLEPPVGHLRNERNVVVDPHAAEA